MKMLFDLFDQIVAEELGISVEAYIQKIEKFSDEDMEIIIDGILSNDKKQIIKAKELFNSKN